MCRNLLTRCLRTGVWDFPPFKILSVMPNEDLCSRISLLWLPEQNSTDIDRVAWTTEIYVSQLWSLGSPRSRYQQIQFWWKPSQGFLAEGDLLSELSPGRERERERGCSDHASSSYKGTDEAGPSPLHPITWLPPKDPPSNSITLEVTASTREAVREHKCSVHKTLHIFASLSQVFYKMSC